MALLLHLLPVTKILQVLLGCLAAWLPRLPAAQDPSVARAMLREGAFAGLRDNVRCARGRTTPPGPLAACWVMDEVG
jgi:hypothetical protein